MSDGPLFVCTSCNQSWFRENVHQANFLKCNVSLKLKCTNGTKSVNNIEWVCLTCKLHLNAGKIPECSIGNGMKFPHIPSELKGLTQLEERLISPRIPFMMIREQLRGGQFCIKGNVVNVPSDVNKTVRLLPRSINDDETILVRFKRKLSYDTNVYQETIRTNKVVNAVKFLVNTPVFQAEGVKLDENWSLPSTNDIYSGQKDARNPEIISDNEDDSNIIASDSWTEDIVSTSEKKNSGNLDTLLSPIDFREFNKILNLAPGEGNCPLGLFKDIYSEFLSFPTIYCGEARVPNKDRSVPVHYSTIAKWELRNVDRRVACSIPNIFFKLKKLQIKYLQDKVQLAVRKCKLKGKKITVQDVMAPGAVDKLVKHNEGYQILKTLRGSPAYWEAAKKDLFAMIKQLGIPTWFISLSAAETKWESLLVTLARLVDNKILSPNDALNLSWHEKCRLIKSDPVTCARYFEYRVQKFLSTIMMGPCKPLGDIKDYFYRVEFQQRGSPHIHMVSWVYNAPDIANDTHDAIQQFIDQHLTCANDPEIPDLVNYQTHRHSRTCRKKGKSICRFNYPIPPMLETKILVPLDKNQENITPTFIAESKNRYEKICKKLNDLKFGSDIHFSEFLKELGMSEREYINAIRSSLQRPRVFLKRKLSEIRINSYNKLMLKTWAANIDIQFVMDAYSCAAYIVSYISKGQRGMSNLMHRAVKEAREYNLDLKQQIRHIGNKFLTHVEVGAQEAVYLVLQMPLRRASRSVIFLNTGPPEDRLTILKTMTELEDMPMNSTNIETDNIIKRYQRRPRAIESMCLANYASWFDVVYPPKVRKKREEHCIYQNCLKSLMETPLKMIHNFTVLKVVLRETCREMLNIQILNLICQMAGF